MTSLNRQPCKTDSTSAEERQFQALLGFTRVLSIVDRQFISDKSVKSFGQFSSELINLSRNIHSVSPQSTPANIALEITHIAQNAAAFCRQYPDKAELSIGQWISHSSQCKAIAEAYLHPSNFVQQVRKELF